METSKILIIEDSKTFNNIIANLLSQYNYNLTQVYNLKDAKTIMQENIFDFILLDLNLPDGYGEELLNEVKAFTNAKIIVMTGDESTHHRDEYFQLGIIDYFIKTTPVQIISSNIHELIQTIKNASNSNILTVDDSSFIRNLLKGVLTEKGYNVYTASGASEALELLQQKSFHLILLDLIMPGVDGISFLEKLKEDTRFSQIPVIVISGDTSRNNYSRVLKNGASDFIRKPFIIEEVLLKCDIHIKSLLQSKKIIESEKEMIKQKSISKLLGNIAHHWRQPLTAISTHASSVLVEREMQIETEENFNKRIEDIIEYTQLLSHTIDDFQLLFSSLELQDKIQTEFFIKELFYPFEEYIKNNNINVDIKYNIESFSTYKDRLKQILTLMIKNIEEHCPNNKHIFLSINHQKDFLIIKLKDSGGGIPKEILKKVFEPYFTTKHQSFSKGIGLYLVYQIIHEDFNGLINLHNDVFIDKAQEYKGVEVTISIPYKNNEN